MFNDDNKYISNVLNPSVMVMDEAQSAVYVE